MNCLIFAFGMVVGVFCGMAIMGLMHMASGSEKQLDRIRGQWITLGDEV